jgi:hypothetical protein
MVQTAFDLHGRRDNRVFRSSEKSTSLHLASRPRATRGRGEPHRSDGEQANRPPAAMPAASEAVRLEWNLSTLPQGYGIAVSHKAGDVALLNAPRGKVKGFLPFIPERPDPADGVPPGGVKSVFVDPSSRCRSAARSPRAIS